MHITTVLFFIKTIPGEIVTGESNQWAYNPKCPTEDAKQNCDNACMDVNVVCTIACGGNYDCISNCTRAYYSCIEDCPCNKKCFQGCPCPEENEYCIPEVELECEEEYDYEFNQCHDQMQQDMFDCVSECDNHDHDCEIDCFIEFDAELENCPCMSKCEEGCPCESFECPENPNPDPTNPSMPEFLPGVISTNKTNLNNSCYDNHWIENSNPIVDQNGFFGMITHRAISLSYSSLTPEKCIQDCENYGIYEYAAVSNGKECWCGNQPPYNETLFECRIPCSGDRNQYCGGREGIASFYSINAKNGDGCEYKRQISADGSHEVNLIQSCDRCHEYQQSWFTFECPLNYHIMYYFEYFNSESSREPSYFYMTYEGRTTSFVGSSPCETCPDLYDWQSTNLSSVEFQYRIGYYESTGFKLALKCRKDSK